MPLYEATWTVTYGEHTLLVAEVDCMDSEPRISPAGEVEVSPLPAAQTPFIQGRKNVRFTLQFSRVKFLPTDAEARDFMLQHVAELPICGDPQPCIIKTVRGGIGTLSNAVLQSPGEVTTEAERFRATYTIIGGPLAWAPDGAWVDDNGVAVADDDGTVVVDDQL